MDCDRRSGGLYGWATRFVPRRSRSFATNREGAVAVVFCLVATVMLGLVGGGIDYARLAARRSQLQGAVDAGALAGGNALKLALSGNDAVVGVTEQTVRSEAKSPPDRPLTVQVAVASDKTNVTVTAAETFKLTFGSFVGLSSAKLAVKAQASVVGRMRLCMLALDPLAAGAFNFQQSSEVTAYGCALYSNSVSAAGLVAQQNAIARAHTICSAGGYVSVRANFSPTPQAGCPAIEDPLKNRAAPPVDACPTAPDAHDAHGQHHAQNAPNAMKTISTNTTLTPGTYCGGLHITWNAVVRLQPGIYVMKDGPLIVDLRATMTGTDVGFYFTGNNGGLVFGKNTTINLKAPPTGVMAGFLMSEERTVDRPVDPTSRVSEHEKIWPTPIARDIITPMRTYRILSDDARTMLGTIYLPAGRLVIESTKPVADQSAYTVIVARQINLYQGPNLVLNANYNDTNVPVPKGVGPLQGRLLLTQ